MRIKHSICLPELSNLFTGIIRSLIQLSARLFAKSDAASVASKALVRRKAIMPDIHKIIDDLKRTRDEVKLHIHLGSKDAQAEWAELEKRWHTFRTKAELDKSADELSGSVKTLGSELKDAYVRLRKAF
jgi:predicted transcriptional regulator